MTDTAPDAALRDQLRACIDDAGRHQVTIAAELGVTTKHLCAMLTGRAKLTLEWAERIAGACGREVVVAVVDPDAGVRDQIEAAMRRDDFSITTMADAVLPVVEAALTEQRERAEQAERDRAQALDAVAAERRDKLAAQAAVRRVRELHAPEEDPHRVRDCKGCRTVSTFTLYENCPTLAALDAEQPKETP